ncbi:MAG: helix-turn-helix transcriptional regulator [Clostridia bacterium]|nr:helix-turn-helix transcriptional regulator [Clostridia bacterium]
MVYSFEFDRLPEIDEAYALTRKTVWETSDSKNIIIVVLEGACCIEMDSKRYIVRKGETFFIPKTKVYRRTPVEDLYCRMLYIHFELSSELYEMTSKEAYTFIEQKRIETEGLLINESAVFPKSYTLYLQSCIGVSSKVTEITERMVKQLYKVSLNNSLPIVLLFCELLNELSRITLKALDDRNLDEEIVRIPENLKKAILYIKQNIFDRISIPELAEYCNISQSQLTRYFKNAAGKTPIQYINDFKLNRAKNMLVKMPQLSVKNVAESLGFDDQQYFSRLFSKTFSETPTEYRYRVLNYVEKKVE